ncbi:MAG: hypothetical protein K6G64_06000 [Eubacterium sp.]|nr:hypothetical protein [Eubacterium sp.]
MKKITSRILSVLLAMILTVSVISVVPTKAETKVAKAAYLTIEKFTLGQGFLVYPTKVEITEGDTIKTVLDKVAKEEKIDLVYTTTEYGTYLSGIKNADSGKVNIPSEISAMGEFESYGTKYPAPTNTNVRPNTNENGLLSEMTYTDMAGWMVYLNNESSMEGLAAKVKDGDVIRIQFSIYGWGLDLGSADWTTGEKKINLANKDNLYKAIADFKANGTWKQSKSLEQLGNNAVAVAGNYNGSQSQLDGTAAALKALEAIFEDGKKAQKAEDAKNQAAPTVAKATVKRVSNVKGCKAKATVKTVKGASGYEFKYATNSKLKNAVVVSTKKTSIKTAKVKKKKTVYVKVRAYVTKNGAYYFGKWSAAKSVKIKK